MLGHLERFLPSSSYATSMRGLTWSQIFNSPLPPYLSPLPVIFRVMAYIVIAPVILFLFLDVLGYIVFRIYEQQWTGPRTAFYKFRTSPVFTRSRMSSPKTGTHALSASSRNQPTESRGHSISPVSSSASLTEDYHGGLTSDPDDNLHTTPSSPVMYFSQPRHADGQLAQRQAYKTDEGDARADQTTPIPGRQQQQVNSLGLGLENTDNTISEAILSPSAEIKAASASDDSPGSSPSGLEEDDKAFTEAKEALKSR